MGGDMEITNDPEMIRATANAINKERNIRPAIQDQWVEGPGDQLGANKNIATWDEDDDERTQYFSRRYGRLLYQYNTVIDDIHHETDSMTNTLSAMISTFTHTEDDNKRAIFNLDVPRLTIEYK